MNPLLQILPDSIYHNVVHYLDNEIHIGNICIANQTIGVVLPLRIKRKKFVVFVQLIYFLIHSQKIQSSPI